MLTHILRNIFNLEVLHIVIKSLAFSVSTQGCQSVRVLIVKIVGSSNIFTCITSVSVIVESTL